MIRVLSDFYSGFKLLKTPELRPFVLMPLLINFVFYSVAIVLGYFYLNHVIAQLIPDSLHWLTWLIYPLFFVSFCVMGFFSFSMLANLIAAPFYAKLAAKTLIVIDAPTLTVVQPSALQVWKAELQRLRYSLTRTLPLLILFVIPVVNVIAPLIWLVFSAWCVAVEYFGYPLENQGVLFPEQKQQLKTMRFDAVLFGGIVILGQSLPIFNVLISPTAVIAATLRVQSV
jgi:CysZ protein